VALGDSRLYHGLFGDAGTACHFTDAAEIAAMLAVEAALAAAQSDQGLIPAGAAAAIGRACERAAITPAALAEATARNGVPVPALVDALRAEMTAAGDGAASAYVHWGATSQDIIDSALMLRLVPVIALWQGRLERLTRGLGALARAHAELPMAARSYGQVATPTSFGATVAGWGAPILRHRARLDRLVPGLMVVSLGGASGTLAAMGPQGGAVRAALARRLGLGDPGQSWHNARDGLAEFAGWMAGLAGSLGKIAEDLILLAQSGIAEVRISGGGGSSTMPQKENPVSPAVLLAEARRIIALAGLMQGAAIHRQNRDGAAWFVEWQTLPELCVSLGAALERAADLCPRIAPDPGRMAAALAADGGLAHAEALVFALAARMPRPEAQARVAALCREAASGGGSLAALAARDFPHADWPETDWPGSGWPGSGWPETDWTTLLSGSAGLGDAAGQARRFADEADPAGATLDPAPDSAP